MRTQFIDAYAHCGLSKYKPLADVVAAMGMARVDRAVLVQHLGEFDNSYLEEVVATDREKFAGVFLVDTASPQAVDDLARWASTGIFRGLRLVLDSLVSNRLLWCRAAEMELNLVVYAPGDIGSPLDQLEEFIAQHPTTRFVLSHFGLGAERKPNGFAAHDAVFRLAHYANVYLQVSGMHMFCAYPFEDMRHLASQGLASFGPDRMLWGGNYPVVGTDEDYVREVEFIRAGGFGIPSDSVAKITHDTAATIWF